MKIIQELAIAAVLLVAGATAASATPVQAENYTAMSGVAVETCGDTGGGQDVGFIDPNDWMDYAQTIATAGTYRLDLRVSSPYSGQSIQVKVGSTLLATVAVPNTGAWQTYQTVSVNIPLAAGAQTLRLTTVTGEWNINWFELTYVGTGQQIEAENYTAMSGIAVENTGDVGGGQDVGWVDAGDWMDYAISPASSGSYQLSVRVASPNATSSTSLQVKSTVLATITIPNTGSWQVYQTVTATVSLNGGPQTLRITTTTGGWNLNWFSFTPGGQTTGVHIPITEDMVTNELGVRDDRGSFLNLFDEQSGLTTAAPTNTPVTDWRVGGSSWFFPAGLVIDLGQQYDITNIYWYDGAQMVNNGTDYEVKGGGLSVDTGTPFHWTSLFSQNLANDARWHNHPTTIRTRYIHINKLSTTTYSWTDTSSGTTYTGFAADAPLLELAIYGNPVGSPPPPPTNRHTPLNITMDQMIGGVSWWFGDPSTFSAVGITRAYHELWRTGSNNLTDPLDFPDYDAFYSHSTASSQIYPCIQGNFQNTLDKPTYGGDPLDPASYKIHADNMWQWAAHYGHNNAISASQIREPSWATPVAHLGYLNYIEDWNEPDQWWSSSASSFFTPYQLAAMLSADYDGNQSKLGTTFGVKNADPSMKLAMAGLAEFSPDYPKAIQLWANEYRSGSFPADVLNFHHYDQNPAKNQGASPESDNLLGILQSLTRYRNYFQPGKEVWLSEFGWDVDGGSTQQAMTHTQWPNNGYDSEELQGEWMLRAFLIGAKAGVDRMMNYTVEDAGGAWGTYNTCGMIDLSGNKRKSWFYVSTMRSLLTGTLYAGEVSSGNPNVYIYKFKSATGNSGVYAIWCPTSNGTTVSQYKLTFSGSPTTASEVTLASGSTTGVTTALTIQSNSVKIDVSERPVFVVVNAITVSP